MSKKRLDQRWKDWLQENFGRNVKDEDLLGTLLKNQFSIDSIREAMGERFPAASPLLAALPADDIDYRAIANIRLTRADSGLRAQKFPSDLLQLYVIEDYLSGPDCDTILKISRANLRPSTLTSSTDRATYRTSSTCDLSLLKNPAVSAIDRKIMRAAGIRPSYAEGLQAQRYEVGQQYKQHMDYFKPGTAEYEKYAGPRGDRTWTVMIYLNDVEQGGGTKFFAIDRVFAPKIGTALAWNNLYPDGTVNPDTLHAGLPVERGQKFIITKWFRERGSGPMFYDDPAGA